MKPFAFSLVALSSSFVAVANAVPEPVVTPAPVVPRQFFTTDFGGDSFIGYYSTLGTYVADYCPDGATMSFGDSYAGCCYPDDDCVIATSCKGDTVFASGFRTTCDNPAASCNTDYILVSSGENTGWYWLGCATETEHVFYIASPSDAAASTTLPTAAQTTASPAAASSTPSSHPPPSSSRTLPPGTPLPALPTSTALPTSSHHKSASKAWIAGAVLGPILLLALFALLAFLFIRRRRNKYNPYGKNPPPMPPPPLTQYPNPAQHPESVPLQQQQPRQDGAAYGMGMMSNPGHGPASPQPSFLSPQTGYATPGSPMAEGGVSPQVGFAPLASPMAEGVVSPLMGHAEPAPPPYAPYGEGGGRPKFEYEPGRG